MECKIEIEVNGKKEIYEIGKLAKQANGSVLLREKKAAILATVVKDDEQSDGDFLPLMVQYVEKAYAASKIPGGYLKRESKPSDFETLTSRIIDRSLRPLFPKGYAYSTQITVLVLSSDDDVDLQVLALNAASAALYLSDIPVEKNVCGVRVGKINGEYVINPTTTELNKSSLDLLVAGTKDELLMIEMRTIATMESEIIPMPVASDPLMGVTPSESISTKQNMNELSDDEVVEVLTKASEAISKASMAYEEGLKEYKKENALIEYKQELHDESILVYIDEFYKDEIKEAISQMAVSERSNSLKKIATKILEDDSAIKGEWEFDLVYAMVNKYKKQMVRQMIINDEIRADGRALDEVRNISIETNILPSVHGSCLFTRGQTQVLAAATIGSDKDAQMYDLLTQKGTIYENFMLHYNFPGFSVGEASPLKAPGRRELGHGNLAKRAIEPSLNIDDSLVVRLVSEVLESNGSSSMATVCAGSLALQAAGIETLKLVAGVAMGLVVEEDRYAILTDISGLEDHDGDMDFKVAGTKDGITALQMDIKLGGIDKKILAKALKQATNAKEHILAIMQRAQRGIVVNEEILPAQSIFSLHPSSFGTIIGQAGKTIKEIIEMFDVSIDLDKDKGEVKVAGESKAKVKAACNHIKELAQKKNIKASSKEIPQFKEGEIVKGVVKRLVDFGAFVELPGGIDGLLHISKLSDKRVDKVSDILSVDDEVEVKILAQKGHKIELELINKL